MLLAITLAIKDLPAAAGASNAFLHVLSTAIGGRVADVLTWIVIAAMWFCGLSSVTSNSRALFAFARDGGAPFSRPLAEVSERWRTPAAAVWACVAVAFLLALWGRAYSVIVSISTIGLYAAYGLPILCAVRARGRGGVERGPWNLGRWSTVVNVIALGWIVFITVLFMLPPNERTGVTFAALLVGLAALWWGWAQSRYRGIPGSR
jgi:amino acid transporter